MDTKKRPRLDSDQIEIATQTVRAYKHRYRYDIIGRLLSNGRMSSFEIASYLNLDEPYISQQLDVLHSTGLVYSEVSEGGIYFSANVHKLLHLKRSILTFLKEDRY